jgi:type II secretory pathway component PulF
VDRVQPASGADRDLGRTDVLLLAASLFFAVDLVAGMILVRPHFRAMYEPFTGALPSLTQLVLSWWFPVVVIVLGVSATGFALLRIRTRRWRRWVMALAASGLLVSILVYFVGLYLPVVPLG